MSPRIANKDRAELPKPQIRVGLLGLSPLNGLSVSYRRVGVGDVLLDILPESQQISPPVLAAVQPGFTVKPIGSVSLGNNPSQDNPNDFCAEEIPLSGIYFRGLSDALYRGSLPQVILSTPSIAQLSALLNDVMDYVEKMLQFGFFLQLAPVDALFPHVVLVSEGVFFKRLMETLDQQLIRFESLTPLWRRQILAKFHRGMFVDASSSDSRPLSGSKPLNLDPALIQPFAFNASTPSLSVLLSPPKRLRIASNLFNAQSAQSFCDFNTQNALTGLDIVESILTLHGFSVEVENRSANPIERLELEYALNRSSEVILPNLISHQNQNEQSGKATSCTNEQNARQVQQFQKQVVEAIIQVGKRLLAFDEHDTHSNLVLPKALLSLPKQTTKVNGSKTPKHSKPTQNKIQKPIAEELSLGDMTIINSLRYYAEELDLKEAKDVFSQLDTQVKARISQQQSKNLY